MKLDRTDFIATWIVATVFVAATGAQALLARTMEPYGDAVVTVATQRVAESVPAKKASAIDLLADPWGDVALAEALIAAPSAKPDC